MRTRNIHKAALTDAVTPLEEAGKEIAYQAAVEGIVLLENDGCLPLKPGKIALYGAGAKMTIKGGTGSGLMIMIRVFRKESVHTQKNSERN